MTNYNLDELIKHEHTTITIQKTLPENNDDANLRRFKEKSILVVGLTILVTLFLSSVCFVIQDHSNALAMSAALSIASGFAGYLLRGKS